MSAEVHRPDVLAMVLADAVYQDRTTGKYFILGTFSHIYSSTYPFLHPGFAVFLALTDCRGITPLEMRLIDVDEQRPPLLDSKGLVDVRDPLAVQQVVFAAPNVLIPEAGEYRLQLLSTSGDILRERRIFAIQAPSAGGG